MTRPTLAQLRALPKPTPYGPNSRIGMPWVWAYQGGAAEAKWDGTIRGGELIVGFVSIPRSWLLKHRRS